MHPGKRTVRRTSHCFRARNKTDQIRRQTGVGEPSLGRSEFAKALTSWDHLDRIKGHESSCQSWQALPD